MKCTLRSLNLNGMPIHYNEQILLPDVEVSSVIDEDRLESLAELHAAMYLGVLDTRTTKLSKAQADVAAIQTAFPTVRDDPVVLAMAAWFTLLCNVDDEIERLDPEAAQLALSDSMYTLQASVGADFAVVSPPAAACHDPASWRVRAFSKAFVRQIRESVPLALYTRLIDSVLIVWEAMAVESVMKQESAIDADVYLAVRCRTIGLAPFFDLLQASLNVNVETAVEQSALWQLESAVTLAVGLQNDLIGLHKDLGGSRCFNFITSARGQSDYTLETTLQVAVDMHNRAVEVASHEARAVSHGRETDPVGQYAVQVLGFVTRHLTWATGAKRYKPL